VLGIAVVDVVLNWQHHSAWFDWLTVVAAIGFAATWAVLRSEPRYTANARPCLVAALLLVISNSGVGYNGPSNLVAFLVNISVAAPVALLLLRYPLARLARRSERVFVIALSVWAVASQALIAVLWTPDPVQHEWWPTLVHGNHWVDAAVKIVDIISAGFAVLGLALLVRRATSARGLDRRELLPVVIAGLAFAVAGGITVLSYAFISGSVGAILGDTALFAYPIVPISLLIASVQRRLARARIADLTAHIGAPAQPATGPDGLRAELRFALADPALEIAYWVNGAYLDGAGNLLSSAPPDRLVVPIPAHDGSPLAVLYVDPSLERHQDLVAAAVAAAALALENARLHTALLAQLAEVRSAQQRIVEAGLVERRRIERDLHDGAQQRLIAASMTLAQAQESRGDAALLDAARTHVTGALADLRDLARGIHPAILTQAGLCAAIDSLAEVSPLLVYADVPDRRWPPAVEATAYFVVAEALSNAAKHAGGSSVSVRVTEADARLVVAVADDGPGGAATGAGSGLSGLTDRVRALGGRFEIASEPGRGTRLTAEIPCG
jgi:signal transduction histidine kinase